MNKADETLKNLIKEVLDNGTWEQGDVRPYWGDTGEKAYAKFITQYVEEFDISKGEFPITTIKPTAWKTGIREILWIWQEASNDLQIARDKYGIKWWDDWNIGDGTIGYRYGHTVKRYDLMNKLLKDIQENPNGRRKIINLWQETEFEEESKGLNPCAFMSMVTVRGEYLDWTLVQRSQDICGANNINNIQYVALQMMVAKHCGLKPGKFLHVIQNAHLYDRHIPIAEEFLNRPTSEKQPKLIFEPKSDNFFEFTIDDFRVEDYEPQPKINIDIAI
jgi:thymidylate synthase